MIKRAKEPKLSKDLGFPTYEFHISRKARDSYSFDETFFSITGDVVFSNFRAAQIFAAKMNEKKVDAGKSPMPASVKDSPRVLPGEINAMGLFHEVLHFVIDSYVQEINPSAFAQLEEWLKKNVGKVDFEKCSTEFVEAFPPTSVYSKAESAENYLARNESGISNRHIVLKELILLWLENRNPAFDPISELIDDSQLKLETPYEAVISITDKFFETQPKYGTTNSSLLKMLLAPIEAHPNSIDKQLQFIAKHWGNILAKSPYLLKLLSAIDFIKEEGKYFLMLAQAQADKEKIPNVLQAGFLGFGEKESAPVPQFRGAGYEFEPENFSSDLSWMPRLVLIAKNVFVWIDQLSKKYQRTITRLDQIPDEELGILSRRGFSGLWLIGIWLRSHASQRIKHLNGNMDAIASAYSLNSYDISPELGGFEAYQNLKERALKYGIRLASDMVPNHMGIDSAWVMNHPDWFLKSDYAPFPNYTFNGPDLSGDERVGVFIEDGYWSKRDAAVAFKRLDRWTGDVKYIYHGNDGTHMPWNDTAQLDFTNPEAREAVIQSILHVARLFSIIRFDAAMVLSKKHYQRLWFPEPGTGGAIPSRSNFSMTKEQFDSVMPVEFWREVVDRVQKEAPDTLLLAEAFWLMEGYFVRTLGMHRVYNSAFMNMLKREENANYRQVLKNVLEYNPQILKRFVNFLNNPDEETAIAQFGKDDKYFGVCVMMSTMPGLPMFGHGQIEGFTEKYGMEFRRAYRDEHADGNLVSRHEGEIFPLLKRRHHFSEMDNFLLYDFFAGDGTVNEDVFAYSNGIGTERNLVVYNNRFSHAAGWIRTSVGFRDQNGKMVQRTLGDGLALAGGKDNYCIFKDVISGLEYIRSTKSLKKHGLYVELGAYKYNVFMDFRVVHSTTDRPYEELFKSLEGRGVPSIEEEILNLKLRKIRSAFYEAVNAGSLRYLIGGSAKGRLKTDRAKAFKEKFHGLISASEEYARIKVDAGDLLEAKIKEYEILLSLPDLSKEQKAREYVLKILGVENDMSLPGWRILFVWIFLDGVGRLLQKTTGEPPSLIDDWRLADQIKIGFNELGVNVELASYETRVLKEMIDLKSTVEENQSFEDVFHLLLRKNSAQELVGINEYNGVRYFNKERFEDLMGYVALVWAVKVIARQRGKSSREDESELLNGVVNSAIKLKRHAGKSEYQFDEFLSARESQT